MHGSQSRRCRTPFAPFDYYGEHDLVGLLRLSPIEVSKLPHHAVERSPDVVNCVSEVQSPLLDRGSCPDGLKELHELPVIRNPHWGSINTTGVPLRHPCGEIIEMLHGAAGFHRRPSGDVFTFNKRADVGCHDAMLLGFATVSDGPS